MGSTLLIALALVLITEGIFPFISPHKWRETFRKIVELQDGQIRFVGLISISIGLFLLFILR